MNHLKRVSRKLCRIPPTKGEKSHEKNHHSTSTLGITVETRDGVVKLEGKAGSWEEKNLAAKRVIDVPGVKMVFNNMTIERITSMTN